MKLLKQLRELAFEKHLKGELEKIHRVGRPFNGEEVKSIGILYHFSDEPTHQLINEFVDELRDGNRNIKVIGHYSEKTAPHYFHEKLTWYVVNSKNVNWYSAPKAPFVKAFCEEEFDLLIDLTMEDYRPLIWTGALSRAHFKVGRYTERHAKFYDLMIHAEQVQSLSEFIEHVKNYISKINR